MAPQTASTRPSGTRKASSQRSSGKSRSASSNGSSPRSSSSSSRRTNGSRSTATKPRSSTSRSRTSSRASSNGSKQQPAAQKATSPVSKAKGPVIAGIASAVGLVGGAVVGSRLGRKPKRVLGIPVPGTGRGVDGLAKQVQKAGKQFGELAEEVRTARKKAEDIGNALS